LDNNVIIIRALSTIGGAALAVVGEFALLPTWDKKWLPRHIASAIHANYNYFLFTYFPNNFSSVHQWTHYRRIAESSNSNAFDSFNRYTQEPTSKDKDYTLYYQLISHCIRITRELNNYHLEAESNRNNFDIKSFLARKLIIKDCLLQYNRIEHSLQKMSVESEKDIPQQIFEEIEPNTIPISDTQSIYVDKLNVELNAFVRDMGKWEEKQLNE
jgi:uncharacterized membrane protein YccC